MDPVNLDEIRKKRKAELIAQLKELKSELKERKEKKRSLPSAKVTDGDPNKLSEMEKLDIFLAEVKKKQRAATQKAYSNYEPLINRFNSQKTRAAPPNLDQMLSCSQDWNSG